jgi:hypothetical protein
LHRQKGLVPPTQPQQLIQPAVYNKDAALFAIKRLQSTSLDEFLHNDETPITRSIHLLSALVLRNFSLNCPMAKRLANKMDFDLLQSLLSSLSGKLNLSRKRTSGFRLSKIFKFQMWLFLMN